MSRHRQRLPLRPLDDLDAAAVELFEGALQPGAPPAEGLVRTLLWNPGLCRRWLPYGARLLTKGKLPARTREICILRVAVRNRSDYEWSQHVPIAFEAGLTEGEIVALAGGTPGEWSELDRAVIAAVDEMMEAGVIGEATWTVLVAHLGYDQLVELPMLVGAYVGLAFLLNSVGTPVEDGLHGLPAGN